MINNTQKGALYILLSAFLFGSYGIWSVLLGKEFGVFFQGYVRSGLVLLILIPFCYFTNKWVKIKKSDYKSFYWCCCFAIFTQAPLYYAFQNSGIGISSLIFFAVSLVTSYFVGAFLLSEKLNRIKVISLFLAIIGLSFIFYTSLGVFSVFALCMAGLNGVSSGGEVSTTKLIPQKFSAIQISIVIWFTIFITHLPMSLLFGEKQIKPELSTEWVSMICFAIAGVVAFYLVVEGYKYVEASIGGLIGLLEIVFAIIFGVLVFKESLALSIIFGSVIILISASLPHLIKDSQQPNKKLCNIE